MKQRTSFMKRFLALAMALVLIASNANLGLALRAFAADEISVSVAEVVANNYDLTEAEKNLLESGNLVSDTISYTVPTNDDGLVTVDTENAKIIAESKDGWVATSAVITYNGNELEVALTDGEGTYDAETVGNAFSVEVNYELTTTVDTTVQENLLGAVALLKQGVANTDAVAAQAGNLYVLEQALPTLYDLAQNGINLNGFVVEMDNEAAKSAIIALHGQMTANGGVLDLSNMITAYEASTKTGYLFGSGAAMQAEVVTMDERVAAIAEWLDDASLLIKYLEEEQKKQLNTLSGVISNMNTALAAVAADPWTAANSTGLVAADANYAELDTLVAALGDSTAVTVNETLTVDTTSIQTNMAMWNVYIQVVMNAVNAENVVAEYARGGGMVTLADGATGEEVAVAIEDCGALESAVAFFGDKLVEGKYTLTVSEIPETLTEDVVIYYTYNPNYYTVTVADETAEYPYGYQLTLPVHEDPAKSYDYKANGTYYAQGSVVTVEDNMTFTREEGKSYTDGQLLAIIADNYASEKATAILNSKALLIDEAVSYREPSKAELEELVKLDGNTLTVQSYASSYAGLDWVPYSYVVDGVENLFNGATEVTLSGDFTTVNVYYRLVLSNYTADDVKEILDLVATLVDEAEGQKSVMDKLAGYEGQMGQLTKNMLNGLNGVIGGYSTENGGGLNDDPATNDELVAYFQKTIGEIVKTCTDSTGYLKLYNIILAYNDPNNGGLIYYYQNAETVRGEIAVLSGYLNDMLDGGPRQAALEKLMTENGYGDKVDVLETLGAKLAEIAEELKPVNAAINTSDAAKLSALTTALSAEGSVEYTTYGSPYIEMGPVIRTAARFVTVEVKAVVGDKSATTSVTIEKGAALTQEQVDALKAEVNSFVAGAVEVEFYNNDFASGAELDALVGVALDEGANYTYTWTPKEYTVKIAGEADQTVTIKNLTINLPAHPNAANGMSYEYTVGSKTASAGIYTFSKEELTSLFVDGSFTITRTEKNDNVEKLVKMVNDINASMGFEALTLVGSDGAYTGINANIAAGDLMDFVSALVLKSGYGYIGLNDEGLVYSNDKAELEICIQTLINAILTDDDFSNDTIIALGENGKGKVMTASMQLGASAQELQYSDLTFTLNLKSVPEQLTNNVNALKTVSNYVYAYSDNGVLAVEVTLPDQVYGAYAAALIATGNVDKTDVNALNQAVAVQFLYDYVEAITGSEMDLVTFNNTLNMLGVDKDFTEYNTYYNKAIAAYNTYVAIAIGEEGTTVDVAAPGQKTIDALIKFAGINKDSVSTYLPMIKEYKAEGTIEASAVATLENTDKTYYALIVDAQASGVTNKFEAPSSYDKLAAETASLAGYSAMILLDDVDGDLTISGTTVLDLNGKSVNGTINATGTLYIIDSSMDTYNAGSVNSVSGNAVIIGGNYNSDVSSYLKDGYYMDGTTVRNALYYITDAEGTVTFVINGDVYDSQYVNGYIPNAKALAVDIAGDLLLNYFTAASLSVEGNEVYAMNVEDLVGLYAGENTANNAIKALLNCFTIGEAGYEANVGFEAVVNMILEDLVDFAAIESALTSGDALATYAVTTNPWLIELEHITDDDYVTVNVSNNTELTESFNIALVLESKYNEALAAMAGELAEIVEYGEDGTQIVVDIPNPTYANKELTVVGNGKAIAKLDMSKNSDYATIIGVILAYGNPEKAEAVAAAIAADDMDALKEVVDNTTVEEVFTALKVMSRTVDYAAMAEKVGVTATESAAELEGVFHVALCAAGKVLEELDITGRDSKLGNLYNEETGYYELTKENIFRDGEYTVKGYTAMVELTATELTLKVKLFGEVDCLWGDADHDGFVDEYDATLVLQYFVGTLAEDQFFCTKRTDVDGDGSIDEMDATLILQHYVGTITQFPVEE